MTNLVALQSTNAILDPSNESDLGGFSTAGEVPAGSYQLATLTIRSGSNIPQGSYTLTTAALALFDQDFLEVPGVANPTYTIVVVPEPSAPLIAGLGLTVPLFIRRRRDLRASETI